MRDLDRANVKTRGAARKAARTTQRVLNPHTPRPMRELAY